MMHYKKVYSSLFPDYLQPLLNGEVSIPIAEVDNVSSPRNFRTSFENLFGVLLMVMTTLVYWRHFWCKG